MPGTSLKTGGRNLRLCRCDEWRGGESGGVVYERIMIYSQIGQIDSSKLVL